jgi:hypothetical protein
MTTRSVLSDADDTHLKPTDAYRIVSYVEILLYVFLLWFVIWSLVKGNKNSNFKVHKRLVHWLLIIAIICESTFPLCPFLPLFFTSHHFSFFLIFFLSCWCASARIGNFSIEAFWGHSDLTQTCLIIAFVNISGFAIWFTFFLFVVLW